jgi:RNA polymerase sigma-70 factor, ECF subfamily
MAAGERMSLSDRIVAKRILAGNRQAAEEFVHRSYPRILRFLTHLAWGQEEAHDLAQQTFVQAQQGLASFRFECSLDAWLHRIAYREYVQWLRRRRLHEPIDAYHEIAAAGAGSDDLLVLWEALERVGEPLREAFLLVEVQGLTVAEAAKVLEIPAGTVKSRLHHARIQLRRRLGGTAERSPHSKMEENHEIA